MEAMPMVLLFPYLRFVVAPIVCAGCVFDPSFVALF